MHFIRRKAMRLFLSALCLLLAGCGVSSTEASGNAAGPVAAGDAPYDIVIRNGRVLDGAGNPWVIADVAIKDGRFAAVGAVDGAGVREIDASGQYVSPGWIDAMDISGKVLLESGAAENKLRMGVTTLISGEIGTPVPAEEIKSYFDRLEKRGISVNFASMYTATQARVAVMGDVARAPTPDELEEMKARIDAAMRAGSLGVATALIYPPATYHSTDELVELLKVAAPYGGIYATHMRDEGKDIVAAIEEAVEIGEKAGVRVEIFHLKVGYEPGWGTYMAEVGRAIEEARARGVDIAANLYPYVAGATGFEVTMPPEVFADGYEAAHENLNDPAYRAELVRRVDAGAFGDWSENNLVVSAGGWDGVVLLNAYSPEYDRFANRSIADIAAELDRHPLDVVIDIMLEALPQRASALYFLMSEEDVRTALQFPWTSIGSDAAASIGIGTKENGGKPHPRAYGTFPRIISEYVRKNDVLSLEEAVRKMTSWPATRHGLMDRGVIREGMWADVVIFDYDELEDKATWDDSAAYPTGISYVLVNGVVTVDEDGHTGAEAGQVLRGMGARRAAQR